MTHTTKPPATRRFARMPQSESATRPEGKSLRPDDASAASGAAQQPKPTSKTGRVIALLQRRDGATLADLIAETGWLPHTTRAALTGLRKKGHAIVRSKRDQITCYRIMVAV